MLKSIEEERESSGRNILFVTDQKERSIHWYQKGLSKAMEGYASTQFVDRDELIRKINDGERISLVVLDTVYTGDWKSYVKGLSNMGIGVVAACASPTFEDARDLFRNGGVDYIRQTLVLEDLRQDVLRACQIQQQKRPL